jgi:hypothetical protein
MTFTRHEIEDAFDRYKAAAAEAGRTGNWEVFLNRFTDDVHYIEHYYGEFHGKQAVREWIVPEMAKWPFNQMQSYPWDWHVIDEEKGWIVGQIANVMTDPGDGLDYRAVNWTRLVYAGDGLFSEEEDVYNPAEFGTMVSAWLKQWKAHHPEGDSAASNPR